MARKTKEDTILEQLEIAQAQEVLAVDTKLRNQVVLSLLHSASVYSISDDGVLRARVRRCMEIADIVVYELEKKND
jgi:DNA-binding sugar fermentation-stimulating protein